MSRKSIVPVSRIFKNECADQASSQPKSQPKPASASKAGRKRDQRGRPGRGRNAGRAKKTAEELDADMADYFGDSGAANNGADAAPAASNGAAQPAVTEDLGMDEISVRRAHPVIFANHCY